MTSRWIEAALWSIGLAGAMRGAVTIHAMHGDTRATVATMPVLTAVAKIPSADSLTEAVTAIVDDNLFRADRAAVEDNPQPPSPVVGSEPPKPPKPALALRGILGGPPWDAVIDGIPGHEAAMVLRAGQLTNGLSVRSVSRDSVVIRGMDTTWRLILRHP